MEKNLVKLKALPIFKKFLISYALLVAVPTIILATVVIVFFYRTYFDENIKLLNEVVSQQVKAFDENIAELNKIAQSVSYNPYLSQGYVDASIANKLLAVHHINSYEVVNGFDAKLHAIYFNSDTILTSEGTMSAEYYLKKYDAKEISVDRLREKLAENGQAYIQRLEAIHYRYQSTPYVYVAPLNQGGGSAYGCALFFLQNERIADYLANINSIIHSPCFILDNNGGLFATSGDATQELMDAALTGRSQRFKYGGEAYYLVKLASSTTGLTFYAATRPYELHANFLTLMKIIGFCLIFILICATFLIYYFMKVNYKPISALERSAVADNREKRVTLQTIMSDVSERLETLSSYYTASIDQRTNRMLLGLLTGSITEQEQLQAEQKQCAFALDGRCFAACAMLFTGLTTTDKQMLREHVSDFVEVKCYPVDVVKKNSLAFIISADKKDEQLLLSAVQALQTGICGLLGEPPTIGVGNWVDNPLEIYNSYVNSLSSLEARLVKGLGSIIMFYEIKAQTSSTFQYPYQLVEQFQNALLSNNRALIMESIDRIFNKIKKSDMAIITTRTFCYNIVQMAVRTLSGNTPNGPMDSLANIYKMMESETVDTMAQSLKNICAQYLDRANAQPLQAGGNHLQNMQEYIALNYCDPDFSLQKMADYFKMSPSYVSRYFAAQNGGVTMLDYTNRLRMEKAKELLASTDMPIPDIAKEVAFLNLSSFNRKFKQVTGVPPGVYRNQAKGGVIIGTQECEDAQSAEEADK